MMKISIFVFLFLFSGSLSASYFENWIPLFPYVIAAGSSSSCSKTQMHCLQEKNIQLYEAIIEVSKDFRTTSDLEMLRKYGEVYEQAVGAYEKFGATLTEEQQFGFKKNISMLSPLFYITAPIPEVLSLEQELYILSKQVEEFRILNKQDLESLFSTARLECTEDWSYSWCKKRYPLILGCVYCTWYYLIRAA